MVKLLKIRSRNRSTILFILLIPFSVVFAQPEWEFSGYITDLPVYSDNIEFGIFRSDAQIANISRLRLRPTAYFGQNARLAMEYEISGLYHQQNQLFTTSSDKTARQFFDWRWQPVNEENVTISHFIDRLYWRQDFGFGNLTVGRQRVAWGSGRIWNPTDLFNPINPAAFDKIEKDGADLLTAQIYLGNFTDLTVVHNPQKSLRKNNAAAKFRTNYQTYDISILGGYFDERIIFGGDFAGNLLTAGLRGEWIFSAQNDDFSNHFVKYIVGIDYQFSRRIYSLLEYQFNGEGATSFTEYDFAGLANGRLINLNRNYLFSQTMIQLHDLVSSGIGWNGNLNDGSGFFALTVSYNYRANLDLQCGGQLYYGRTFSEYGFYPTTLFGRVSWYF